MTLKQMYFTFRGLFHHKFEYKACLLLTVTMRTSNCLNTYLVDGENKQIIFILEGPINYERDN